MCDVFALRWLLLKTALVCEPDIIWNARVIYVDLLSSLYIDTAAPTKG